MLPWLSELRFLIGTMQMAKTNHKRQSILNQSSDKATWFLHGSIRNQNGVKIGKKRTTNLIGQLNEFNRQNTLKFLR